MKKQVKIYQCRYAGRHAPLRWPDAGCKIRCPKMYVCVTDAIQKRQPSGSFQASFPFECGREKEILRVQKLLKKRETGVDVHQLFP